MTELPPGRAELVATSLRVLADGQAASGAFVASPTFSQYPFAWLRDGAFIAEALDLVGEHARSARFHAWVARVVLSSRAGVERAIVKAARGRLPDPDEYLHCRYDLDGRPVDDDWPRFQLDGPGIWLWALQRHVRLGGSLDPDVAESAVLAARYLAALWPLPCADAWEESPERVHASTLAAIAVGLDAARSLVPGVDPDGSMEAARLAIHATLATWRGSFTKWRGSRAVDASLLWIAAPYEMLPPHEPRFAATLARIETELMDEDGGVHRFRDDTYYGGGAWPILTSAYGRVLVRRGSPGDLARARRALAWIEAQADERGNLPEQVADRAFAPERIGEWRIRWGESARPLLWSHAAYLALRAELASSTHMTGNA